MRWKNFAVLAALAVVIITVIAIIFTDKRDAVGENLLVRSLAQTAQNLSARGDASRLTYDAPRVSDGQAIIDSLDYRDGGQQLEISASDIKAQASIDGISQGSAGIIAINNGNTQTHFQNLQVMGLRENPRPIGQFDAFEFDELRMRDFTVVDNSGTKTRQIFAADAVILQNLSDRRLGRLALENFRFGNDGVFSIGADSFVINDVDYRELDTIIDALGRGDIPLGSLMKLGIGSITSGGANFKLDGEDIVKDGQGQIDQEDALDLFLKNAPEELRQFLGTDDAAELSRQIEDFNEKEPRDQAIGALELLLERLKNSDGAN